MLVSKYGKGNLIALGIYEMVDWGIGGYCLRLGELRTRGLYGGL